MSWVYYGSTLKKKGKHVMKYEAPSVADYVLARGKRTKITQQSFGRFKNSKIAIETDKKNEMPLDRVRFLAAQAFKATLLKPRLDHLTKRRSEINKELIKAKIDFPEFNGFNITKPEQKTVRVRAIDEIEWDGEKLKQNLGELASPIVAEEVRISLVIPSGNILTTKEAQDDLLQKNLEWLGLNNLSQEQTGQSSEQDKPPALHVSTEYSINIPLLSKLLERGQISPNALDGTGEVTRNYRVEIN